MATRRGGTQADPQLHRVVLLFPPDQLETRKQQQQQHIVFHKVNTGAPVAMLLPLQREETEQLACVGAVGGVSLPAPTGETQTLVCSLAQSRWIEPK